MFIFLVFFLTVAGTVALSLLTSLITEPYHFYWVIIFFVGSYVASILLILIILLFTSLFIRYDPKKANARYSKRMRFIMEQFMGFLMFFFRIKIKVTGKELIPQNTRFLMVGNHLSDLDPLVAIWVFRGMDISWVAKEVLFKIPLAKKYMYRCDFLAMDRADVRQSLRVINQAAAYVKEGTVSMGIYPEGTRNTTSDPLLPFKPGALKVAQKAGAPIVVTAMVNTQRVFRRWPLRSTHIYLDVIKVYSAEEVLSHKTNDLSEEIAGVIKDRLVTLNKYKA